MSASPNDVQDDVEKQSVDELAEGHTADDAEPGQSPSYLSPFVFRRHFCHFRRPLPIAIAIGVLSLIPPYPPLSRQF
jgi:hypothetical protein